LRYSDDFTTDHAWDGVSYEARWHYHAMVEECSQARRWDGRLPLVRARRCSDVPDPDKCVGELTANGWVRMELESVVVLNVDDHLPPPHVRNNAELSKLRMRRMRAHRAGDHRLCDAGKCEHVTQDVTRNTGTGRDGTGSVPLTDLKDLNEEQEEHAREVDPWEVA
jgi:hypothetical protein